MKKVLGLFNPHYVKDHIYAILRQVGGHNKIAKIAVKDGKTQGKFHIVLLINQNRFGQLSNELNSAINKLDNVKKNS